MGQLQGEGPSRRNSTDQTQQFNREIEELLSDQEGTAHNFVDNAVVAGEYSWKEVLPALFSTLNSDNYFSSRGEAIRTLRLARKECPELQGEIEQKIATYLFSNDFGGTICELAADFLRETPEGEDLFDDHLASRKTEPHKYYVDSDLTDYVSNIQDKRAKARHSLTLIKRDDSLMMFGKGHLLVQAIIAGGEPSLAATIDSLGQRNRELRKATALICAAQPEIAVPRLKDKYVNGSLNEKLDALYAFYWMNNSPEGAYFIISTLRSLTDQFVLDEQEAITEETLPSTSSVIEASPNSEPFSLKKHVHHFIKKSLLPLVSFRKDTEIETDAKGASEDEREDEKEETPRSPTIRLLEKAAYALHLMSEEERDSMDISISATQRDEEVFEILEKDGVDTALNLMASGERLFQGYDYFDVTDGVKNFLSNILTESESPEIVFKLRNFYFETHEAGQNNLLGVFSSALFRLEASIKKHEEILTGKESDSLFNRGTPELEHAHALEREELIHSIARSLLSSHLITEDTIGSALEFAFHIPDLHDEASTIVNQFVEDYGQEYEGMAIRYFSRTTPDSEDLVRLIKKTLREPASYDYQDFKNVLMHLNSNEDLTERQDEFIPLLVAIIQDPPNKHFRRSALHTLKIFDPGLTSLPVQ